MGQTLGQEGKVSVVKGSVPSWLTIGKYIARGSNGIVHEAMLINDDGRLVHAVVKMVVLKSRTSGPEELAIRWDLGLRNSMSKREWEAEMDATMAAGHNGSGPKNLGECEIKVTSRGNNGVLGVMAMEKIEMTFDDATAIMPAYLYANKDKIQAELATKMHAVAMETGTPRGDLHSGNVMLSVSPQGKFEMRLIDQDLKYSRKVTPTLDMAKQTAEQFYIDYGPAPPPKRARVAYAQPSPVPFRDVEEEASIQAAKTLKAAMRKAVVTETDDLINDTKRMANLRERAELATIKQREEAEMARREIVRDNMADQMIQVRIKRDKARRRVRELENADYQVPPDATKGLIEAAIRERDEAGMEYERCLSELIEYDRVMEIPMRKAW